MSCAIRKHYRDHTGWLESLVIFFIPGVNDVIAGFIYSQVLQGRHGDVFWSIHKSTISLTASLRTWTGGETTPTLTSCDCFWGVGDASSFGLLDVNLIFIIGARLYFMLESPWCSLVQSVILFFCFYLFCTCVCIEIIL